MSNYVKYSDLAKLTTQYCKRMTHLSNKIFVEVARPTNSKSMKVVKLFQAKPVHLNKDLVNYYPRHPETHRLCMTLRSYGLFRDEHQDFIEEMDRLRALRGKVNAKGEKRRQELMIKFARQAD